MDTKQILQIRKLSQQYAYDSIKMHETIAQKAGLSGTEHKYLGFLIVKGQMTAGELSELTGLTTGAVTGLIDRFERKKLVKRKFARDDRRKVLIDPNIKNIMALLEPIFKEFGKQTEELIASFTKKELKTVETFLLRSIEIAKVTTDLHNVQNRSKK